MGAEWHRDIVENATGSANAFIRRSHGVTLPVNGAVHPIGWSHIKTTVIIEVVQGVGVHAQQADIARFACASNTTRNMCEIVGTSDMKKTCSSSRKCKTVCRITLTPSRSPAVSYKPIIFARFFVRAVTFQDDNVVDLQICRDKNESHTHTHTLTKRHVGTRFSCRTYIGFLVGL